MASRGKLTGGIGWREVVLNKRADMVGDRVAIFLSVPSDSIAPWTFRVQCLTDQGSIDVGGFTALVPVPGGPLLPSRLVATANCPGAIGWKISAHNEVTAEKADCWLASLPGTSGEAAGVQVVRPGSTNPTAQRQFFDANGVQAPTLILPAGAQLWQVEGDLQEIAAANQGTVAMLFDSILAPGLGAAPIFSKHLGQNGVNDPSDGSHYLYNPGPYGRLIVGNLWLAVSTTGGTFTQDVNHHVDAHEVFSVG